jgi:uncharacterized protein YkwD
MMESSTRAGVTRAIALLALALGALTLFADAAPAARTRARATADACAWANLRPTRTNAAKVDAATLCLIDRTRVAHGLAALRANRQLQAVAVSQVTSMVRLDYFADDRPSGATPLALILQTSYGRHARSVSAAENIGWGTGGRATPAQMVAGWLRSAAHRAAILTGEFSEAGVGTTAAAPSRLAQGRAGATYALELARTR